MHLVLGSLPESFGTSIMTEIRRSIRVIGIGNRDRGDDGLGPLVVERLSGRIPRDASLGVRHGDALSLLDDWKGADPAILVDAAALISAPGVIHRIDLIAEMIPLELSLASTHAFGISQAISLGRVLDLLPRHLILYAVEGENFARGFGMTPAVSAAAELVAQRILGEISGLRHDTRDIPGTSVHA